jgi:hypothetical protein
MKNGIYRRSTHARGNEGHGFKDLKSHLTGAPRIDLEVQQSARKAAAQGVVGSIDRSETTGSNLEQWKKAELALIAFTDAYPQFITEGEDGT